MLGLSASKWLRPPLGLACLLKAEVLGWGKDSLAFTYQVTDDSSSTLAANCSILQVTLLPVPGHRGSLSHRKSERPLLTRAGLVGRVAPGAWGWPGRQAHR